MDQKWLNSMNFYRLSREDLQQGKVPVEMTADLEPSITSSRTWLLENCSIMMSKNYHSRFSSAAKGDANCLIRWWAKMKKNEGKARSSWIITKNSLLRGWPERKLTEASWWTKASRRILIHLDKISWLNDWLLSKAPTCLTLRFWRRFWIAKRSMTKTWDNSDHACYR